MDWDRVLAVNVMSLNGCFGRLSEFIARNHTGPDDLWILDEQAFMMEHGGKKNELISSRVRIKAPAADVTRKL